MIHFFPRFSRSAADTPFGDTLRAIGAEHRIFSIAPSRNYRYRWQLLLIGYPILAWRSFRAATRSLLERRGTAPDAVVISSDIEALVVALVRLLPWASKPRIFFMPFIFTARASGIANRLRTAYYRLVLRCVSCAICHSELEVARYRDLFAGCGAAFIFVPWGAHMPSVAEIIARVGPLPPVGGTTELVSAGRSGRDYPTLAAAMDGLTCRLTIICNEVAGLGAVTETGNLRILRDCFLHEYMWHLLRADIVVVPLRVDDISAGQMVMIQGMALGRPLIVTRTPTVEEYLQDGFSALLVPRGDAASLQAAIRRLMADTTLAAMLGRNARREYETRFSGEAHLRALVAAIERHCGIPAGPGVAVACARPGAKAGA